MGTNYKVNSWADMITEVSKLLYELDPTPMYQLISDSSNDLTIKKEVWNVKISEELYLNVANDTMSKIRILKKIFAKYELDESELEFGIPVQSDVEENIESIEI